jgi:hypothetical protein
MPLGGHFEFQLIFFLHGMSLYSAIFLPNMKICRTYFVVIMVINRQNCHYFIENEPLAVILNFQFSPNSFPDIFSPIPPPMLSFKESVNICNLWNENDKGLWARTRRRNDDETIVPRVHSYGDTISEGNVLNWRYYPRPRYITL